MMDCQVVKLGGSLYQSAQLPNWLNKLNDAALSYPIILVPGGGPFANKVREAQHTFQFDDKTAHQMAILAMSQYGLLLLSQLKTATPYFLANGVPSSAGIHVWLPDLSFAENDTIKQNWSVTSDSLALYLAAHINASQLHIIKTADIPARNLNSLTESGLLDQAFPTLYREHPIPTHLFTESDWAHYPDNGSIIR